MAQQLGTCAVLVEDPNSIPSNNRVCLTTTRTALLGNLVPSVGTGAG